MRKSTSLLENRSANRKIPLKELRYVNMRKSTSLSENRIANRKIRSKLKIKFFLTSFL